MKMNTITPPIYFGVLPFWIYLDPGKPVLFLGVFHCKGKVIAL